MHNNLFFSVSSISSKYLSLSDSSPIISLFFSDKYDGGDNTWIGMSNSPGEWCVAYHGVASGLSSDNVKKVTGIICNAIFKEGAG